LAADADSSFDTGLGTELDAALAGSAPTEAPAMDNAPSADAATTSLPRVNIDNLSGTASLPPIDTDPFIWDLDSHRTEVHHPDQSEAATVGSLSILLEPNLRVGTATRYRP
jgi:hypothetical protein